MAGRDYPPTWNQFLEWFAEEDACLRYLQGLRWPEGFVALNVVIGGEPYRATRGRWVFHVCRHQGTVTAGTVFL